MANDPIARGLAVSATTTANAALPKTGGTVSGAVTFSASITFSNDLNLGGGSAITWSARSVLKALGDGAIRWTKNDGTICTVATLPSAATVGSGARSFVSDASAPSFGATVAGGGAVATPVYSDGTNWKVG